MNILSMDPGATRAGWACLGNYPPAYRKSKPGEVTPLGSGIYHTARLPKQTFQSYRMELCERWIDIATDLVEEYKPDRFVSEIVPSRGAEIMDQLYLANVQITTVHTVMMEWGVQVVQVSARTVQAQIARRKPGVKLTKPQVRDGVIDRLPDYADRLTGIKVFEESDALAIGLWYLKG